MTENDTQGRDEKLAEEFEKSVDIKTMSYYHAFIAGRQSLRDELESKVQDKLRQQGPMNTLVIMQKHIDSLLAENKRLHDKYDFQLLVKRDKEQQATISRLQCDLETMKTDYDYQLSLEHKTIDELREALKFYADEKSWKFNGYDSETRECIHHSDLSLEEKMFPFGGKRARAALKGE